MTNRTEDHCLDRTWCDVSVGHTGEHFGEADLPKITATAYREDFVVHDDGILVPEVSAQLAEHEHSNTFDRYSIRLAIVRPDGDSGYCHLNLNEAGLLAKALGMLVEQAGSEQ